MSPALPVLFLAHARADAHLVHDVDNAARAAGLRLWRETSLTPDGAAVPTVLTQAIHACTIFAVLLTRQSIQRSWVQWELKYALSVGKAPIVPIVEEQGLILDAPFDRLNREAYIPLRPGYLLAARLNELVDMPR